MSLLNVGARRYGAVRVKSSGGITAGAHQIQAIIGRAKVYTRGLLFFCLLLLGNLFELSAPVEVLDEAA
jgi:hypothetical protein